MEDPARLTTWTIVEGEVDRAAIKGIDIYGDAHFRNQTIDALQRIAQTRTGRFLLEYLIGRIQRSGGAIGIIIGFPNDERSHCDAQTIADARTELTNDVHSRNAALIAWHIRFALSAPGRDADWFANQLRNTPAYRLEGLPATGLCPLPITGQDVRRWVQGRLAFPQPYSHGDEPFILCNSLLIVLARETPLVPGRGTSSRVFWSMGDTIILTDGTAQQRPAWIGLAHELIHAYYNISGTQLVEVESDRFHGSWTTMIGEYMCVGLGPWADAPVTENAIRAEALIPRRTMY
jgi:hypothetical protein